MVNSFFSPLFSVRLDKIPMSEGLLVALLGLVIVFVVLFVLVGILMVFNKVLSLKFFDFNFLKKKKKTVEVEPSCDEMEDEETVAAITAAIAIILQSESEDSAVKPTFVIKSLKRLN